jgi:antitoxin MazE
LYILLGEKLKTRVQKWGNSLAVRIPKSFAEELDWEEGAPVEMTLDEGALVIRSDRERSWDLAALLDKVTGDNIHAAWETENI